MCRPSALALLLGHPPCSSEGQSHRHVRAWRWRSAAYPLLAPVVLGSSPSRCVLGVTSGVSQAGIYSYPPNPVKTIRLECVNFLSVLVMACILLGIMELSNGSTVYSADTVEKNLREFFRSERKRLKLNQQTVANRGAIEQSTISKIERDAPYQPSVAIFIKAIRGLGMMPSAFFEKFEQTHVAQPTDKLGHSEKTNVRLITDTAVGHNTTPFPQTPGVERHGPPAPVRDSDTNALDQIRFTLREVGTRLLELGVSDPGAAATTTRRRTTKPSAAGHRSGRTSSRNKSA